MISLHLMRNQHSSHRSPRQRRLMIISAIPVRNMLNLRLRLLLPNLLRPALFQRFTVNLRQFFLVFFLGAEIKAYVFK